MRHLRGGSRSKAVLLVATYNDSSKNKNDNLNDNILYHNIRAHRFISEQPTNFLQVY